jgi:hypothetical protein
LWGKGPALHRVECTRRGGGTAGGHIRGIAAAGAAACYFCMAFAVSLAHVAQCFCGYRPQMSRLPCVASHVPLVQSDAPRCPDITAETIIARGHCLPCSQHAGFHDYTMVFLRPSRPCSSMQRLLKSHPMAHRLKYLQGSATHHKVRMHAYAVRCVCSPHSPVVHIAWLHTGCCTLVLQQR